MITTWLKNWADGPATHTSTTSRIPLENWPLAWPRVWQPRSASTGSVHNHDIHPSSPTHIHTPFPPQTRVLTSWHLRVSSDVHFGGVTLMGKEDRSRSPSRCTKLASRWAGRAPAAGLCGGTRSSIPFSPAIDRTFR